MKFNINSRLMDYLNTVAQFVALNIIFIICCLPVITIGPSIAALYQVIMRESRGEHGYIIRKFFQHFKEMFVQSFFTSLLLTAIVLILIFNLTFWNTFGGVLANIIIVFIILILIITACVIIYVFPLMARFKNSFLRTIKNSLLIAISNPKATVFLLIIHAAAISIVYFFPPAKVFLLLIGFSFIAYCNSYILNKVFKNHEEE